MLANDGLKWCRSVVLSSLGGAIDVATIVGGGGDCWWLFLLMMWL